MRTKQMTQQIANIVQLVISMCSCKWAPVAIQADAEGFKAMALTIMATTCLNPR